MTDEEKKELLEKLKKARAERMDKMVTKVLTSYFEKDLHIHTDPNYIQGRLLHLLTELRKKLKPYSKKVTEARKELLKDMLEFAKDSLPKPEKFLATDETEKQKKRCEPVVHEILKLLVDPQHMEDENVFVEHVIADDDEALFESLIMQIAQSLFDNSTFAVNESLVLANKKLWEDKELNKRTFRELDRILKQ